MLENDLDFPKYYRHCYQRAYFISGDYINKIRCRRCPLCGRSILGLSAIPEGVLVEGWEVCSNRHCEYRRKVFSGEELAQLNL